MSGKENGQLLKENEVFFKRVEERLKEMTEAQKDEWILTQARLLMQEEQEDFLKTLSGRKKLRYMPEEEEIEEFCRKVEDGEIVLEYETHYYEFDDDGRYMDDWKIWHNDPDGAMLFLDRVFMGCHELLRLGEHETAAGVLDRVCRLEFQIVEAEDSEDGPEEDVFSIVDAAKEGMLSMKRKDIGLDWLIAEAGCAGAGRAAAGDIRHTARRLKEILEHEMCEGINPEALLGKGFPEGIFLKCPLCWKKRSRKEGRSLTDAFQGRIIPEKCIWRRKRCAENESWHQISVTDACSLRLCSRRRAVLRISGNRSGSLKTRWRTGDRRMINGRRRRL